MNEITSFCREKRGDEQSNESIGNDRLILRYIMPLSEIIVDFHDSLKSISSGYASFDYEDYDYKSSDIVKVINFINGLFLHCVPCFFPSH